MNNNTETLKINPLSLNKQLQKQDNNQAVTTTIEKEQPQGLPFLHLTKESLGAEIEFPNSSPAGATGLQQDKIKEYHVIKINAYAKKDEYDQPSYNQ